MKSVLFGAIFALVGLASTAQAEYTLNVRGTDYPLVALMDNCTAASGGSEAQLKCFNALTKLLKEQSGAGGGAAPADLSVAGALDALRQVAQHQDADSGLMILGNDCNIQVLYYNNYFHMSRRNTSAIDLFSAKFDASRLLLEQTTQVQGQNLTWSKGLMEPGTMAKSVGGVGIESSELGFAPKSARASIGEYARTVAEQLPSREDMVFDFVLVHPKRSQLRPEIWAAFGNLVDACR